MQALFSRIWMWITRIILAIYLIALAASTITRLTLPADNPLDPNQKQVIVPAIDHDRETAQQVRLAYYEYGDPSRPTLILLHGMPGSAGEFDRPEFGAGISEGLGRLFGHTYHVIAPDLPGLGNSSHKVPDYSFRAHAYYVVALMQRLGIERAHILGFSQGGGVAISMIDIAPDKIASVVLSSAIGVQELELLGDYHLNRPLYLAQIGLFWVLENGIPHFGRFDSFGVVNAALNFYESDQRPLRSFMERYTGPMLIIQGEFDGQVPPELGREHARIVPQSQLELLAGGHMMLEQDRDVATSIVLPFLANVDAGKAITRAAADPARVAAAKPAYNPHSMPKLIGIASFSAAVLLLMIALVSNLFACTLAGVLVAQGRMDGTTALIGCLVGIYLGAVIRFRIGQALGAARLQHPRLAWLITPGNYERGTRWVQPRNALRAALQRFLPLPRATTDMAAGATGRGCLVFLGSLILVGGLWALPAVWISTMLARGLLQLFVVENIFWQAVLPALLLFLFLVAISRVIAWLISLLRPAKHPHPQSE